MSEPDPGSDARLRRGFAALADEQPKDDCPAPEALWDAAGGRATPDAVAAIVDHMVSCGSCAAEWRLAVELAAAGRSKPAATELATTERGLAVESSRGDVVPIQRHTRRTRYLAAAGATLALAAGLMLYVRATRPQHPAGWRAPDDPEVRLSIPDEAALDRNAFVLRWEPAGTGARYTVIVTTEDLTGVASAEGVDATSYHLPAAALAAVPPGARVSWRVVARLSDGTSVESKTRWLRVP